MKRTAPTLEAERVKRHVRRVEKTAKLGERTAAETAAFYTVAGVRVDEEVERLWRLPAAVRARKLYWVTKRLAPPAIHVRRAKSKPRTRLGHASSRKIQVVDYPGIARNDILETVAHEVAHCLTPGAGHDVAWKTVFRSLCEEAHGVRPIVERRFHGNVVPLLDAKSP